MFSAEGPGALCPLAPQKQHPGRMNVAYLPKSPLNVYINLNIMTLAHLKTAMRRNVDHLKQEQQISFRHADTFSNNCNNLTYCHCVESTAL